MVWKSAGGHTTCSFEITLPACRHDTDHESWCCRQLIRWLSDDYIRYTTHILPSFTGAVVNALEKHAVRWIEAPLLVCMGASSHCRNTFWRARLTVIGHHDCLEPLPLEIAEEHTHGGSNGQRQWSAWLNQFTVLSLLSCSNSSGVRGGVWKTPISWVM